MYTELSIIFLCIEVALLALLIYFIFWKKAIVDKKSLIYLLPVFVVAYSLYLTATVYNGTKLTFYVFFTLINKTLKMVAMELDYDLIKGLSAVNPWFHAAVIGACALSLITVIFSVVVLFGAKTVNELKKCKCFFFGGDVVVGVSPSALEYLKMHKTAVLWVEDIDKASYSDLLKQGYRVHRARLNAKNAARCFKGKKYNLIVFRDSSYSYSQILSCFRDLNKKLSRKKNKQVLLHIEANSYEMQILRETYLPKTEEFVNSFVLPFCRYELIARRFLIDHPISKYIPRTFFNENLTLKADKQINVVFLGFGKVNYELFKLMCAQFQFAKQENGKLCGAPVQYHIFETEKERLNNDLVIRLTDNYQQIFKGADFSAADPICKVNGVLPMDAHSAETRKRLCELVNENAYTYFIISLSDDFQDTAFARELLDDLDEQGNYKIFVRAKNDEICELNKTQPSIVYFGGSAACFSHQNIINDELRHIAQSVNSLYNEYSHDGLVQLREWQKLETVEQYSNVSAALNVYFKLALLGVDLKRNGEEGMDENTFKAVYADALMDENKDYEYFFGTTTANVLAYIEHSRWNAYYILSGFKPLSYEQFIWETKENGEEILRHKDIDRRRHACLTTYADLDKLIRKKYEILTQAKETGKHKIGKVDFNALADIYRYDYMVIDNLHKGLTDLKYSLVARTEKQEPAVQVRDE